MRIEQTFITSKESIESRHENHGNYEYYKHLVVPREGNQCTVAIMEVPPLKAAYPYHYHAAITEVFYIISGEGLVLSASGEQVVGAGDVVVLPPGLEGVHKITNTSDSKPLCYIDFGTTAPADVVFYPDSQKIGMILGGIVNKDYYPVDGAVEYYDGE